MLMTELVLEHVLKFREMIPKDINEFKISEVFLFGASYDLPDLSCTGWGTYVVPVR